MNQTRKLGKTILFLAAALLVTAALCFLPRFAPFSVRLATTLGIPTSYVTISNTMLSACCMVLLLAVAAALWSRCAWTLGVTSLLGLAVFTFALGYLATSDLLGALWLLLLIGIPSVGLYTMQRCKLNNFRIVIYGTFLTLIALFCYVCLPSLLAEGDAFLPFRSLIGQYAAGIEESKSILIESGLFTEATVQDTLDTLTDYKLGAEQFSISVLLYPAMLCALTNCLLFHLFNRDKSAAVLPLPKFADWRVERWFSFSVTIVVLVCLVLSMVGVTFATALSNVFYLLWLYPLALGGLCAVKRLAKRRWVFPVVLVLGIVLFTILGPVLAFVGLFADTYERIRSNREGQG